MTKVNFRNRKDFKNNQQLCKMHGQPSIGIVHRALSIVNRHGALSIVNHGKALLALAMLLMVSGNVWGAWSGSGQGTLQDGVWYALYETGEVNFSTKTGSHTERNFTLSAPGSKLSFSAKVSKYPNLNPLHAAQCTDGSWSDWNTYTLSTSYGGYGPLDVKRNTTELSFYNSSGSGRTIYLKDIKVTMAQYLEDPSSESLAFDSKDISVGSDSTTFTIAWCNIAALSASLSSNSDVYSVSISSNASAGKYGTATVQVTYNRSKVGQHNATLTLSSGSFSKQVSLSGTTTDIYYATSYAEARPKQDGIGLIYVSEQGNQPSEKSPWTTSGNTDSSVNKDADGTSSTGSANITAVYYAEALTGYTFGGWYTDEECTQSAGTYDKNDRNKYTMVVNTNKTSKPGKQTYRYAHFVEMEFAVTISSADANKGSVSPSGDQTIKYYTGTSVTATAKAGYHFTSWSVTGGASVVSSTSSSTTVTATSAGTLTANFAPNTNTAYIAEYYLENADNEEYTKQDTAHLKGTTDATPTNSKTYTNFTYDHSDPSTPTIKGDGTSVIKYYYKRKTFTLAWTGYESASGTYTPAGQVKHGATLTAPTVTKTGYTFASWSPSVPSTMPAANSTYEAQWTANQYTVTLDFDGGSGGTSSVTATFDAAMPSGATKPSKTGYTFQGYYTQKDGKGTKYYDKDMASVTNWNIANNTTSLYAYWSANPYSVTLNGNESSSSGSATATYDNNKLTNLSAPTLSNYSVVGYFTQADENGIMVADASGNLQANVSGYTDSNGKWKVASGATLYTHWHGHFYAKSEAYSYIPDDVGGTVAVTNDNWNPAGKSWWSSVHSYDHWETDTVHDAYPTINVKYYAKEFTGYSFKGWFVSRSDQTPVSMGDAGGYHGYYPTYLAKSMSSSNPTNMTRYAKFEPNKYNITFNYNDGGSTPTEVKQVTFATNYGTAIPTVSDPTFLGWYTEQVEGHQVTADSAVIASDRTLYAHWFTKSCTISFDACGGSASDPKEVNVGSPYGELPTSTRDGYDFNGWWTAPRGGTQITEGSTVTEEEDHILYAHWKSLFYFQVNAYSDPESSYYNTHTTGGYTTDCDGGTWIFSNNDGTPSGFLAHDWITRTYGDGTSGAGESIKVEEHPIAKMYLHSNTRQKAGYTWQGWYTQPNAQGECKSTDHNYFEEFTVTSIDPNNISQFNRYAYYKPAVYTVEFNGNGATSGSTASMQCTYDVAKNLTANGFSRTGYTFAGWTKVKDAGTVDFADGASVSNLTTTDGGTVTLFAKWTPITYTVAFDGNDATSGSTSSMSFTYDVSQNLTSNGFSKTGYSFDGWSKTKGGAKDYTNGQSVKNLSTTQGATVTLFARWTPNPYTVNFDANEGTVSPTSKTVTYDATYGTLPTPTRTGWTFKGWWTSKESGSQITEGTTVKITATQTLYAHWTINDYQVNYNLNYEGANATNLFTGWKGEIKSESLKMTYDAATGIIYTSGTLSNSNSTSIPQLIPGISVGDKISMEMYDYSGERSVDNGGFTLDLRKNDNGVQFYIRYPGENKLKILNQTIPSDYKNSTFWYWLKDKNKTNPITLTNNQLKLRIEKGATLATTPSPSGKYVTYNTTYGTLANDPVRETWRFDGWYTLASGGSKVESTTPYTQAQNMVLYAHWTPVYFGAAYSNSSPAVGGVTWISLNGNWPSGKSACKVSDSSSRNDTVASAPTMSAYYQAYENDGYAFKGWYSEPNGGGDKINSNLKYEESMVVTSRDPGERTDITRYAYFVPVTVSDAPAQVIPTITAAGTPTATLVFPVANADSMNDFNSPSIATTTGGGSWTITGSSYSNNAVSIVVKFTATAGTTSYGDHSAKVTLTAKSGNSATGNVSTFVNISPTITKSADLKTQYYVDDVIDLSTLWTSNSDGAITYSKYSFTADTKTHGTESDPSISGSTLTMSKAGTLIIHLDQAAGTYYGALSTPAAHTITIVRRPPTFSWGDATLSTNQKVADYFSTNNTNCPITYSSTGKASLFAGSTAHKLSVQTEGDAGSASLTVNQAENYYWAQHSETVNVTTTKPSNHLEMYITSEAAFNNYKGELSRVSWTDNTIEFNSVGIFDGSTVRRIEFNFTGIPDKLTGKLSTEDGAQTAHWVWKQKVNNNWEDLSAGKGDTNDDIYINEQLNPSATAIRLEFSNHVYAGYLDLLKVTELQYFRRQGSGTIDFGTNQQGSTAEVKSFVVEHCNAGYQTGIKAPAQYQISFNANSGFTDTLTYSTNADPQTGGDKMGTFTVYVKSLTSVVGTHGGNVVVSNNLRGKINVPVTSNIVPKYTPDIKNNIQSTYLVDNGPISLSTLWKSDSDGKHTYTATFTPAGTKMTGAVTPALDADNNLSLGQDGTVQLHLDIAETDAYYGASADFTITINKHTPTATWSGQTYYYNGNYSNVYTITNGDAALFSITSSKQDVAVVNGSNMTIFNKPGTTTLTLSALETYKWKSGKWTNNITPIANPEAVAFTYTEALFDHSKVTVKTGSPVWLWSGYNKDKTGKLRLINSDAGASFVSNVIISYSGTANKVNFEYSDNQNESGGIFYILRYLGGEWNTSSMWKNKVSSAEVWTTDNYDISASEGMICLWYYNSNVGGEWANIKFYGSTYILTPDNSSVNFGTHQTGSKPVRSISLAHANIGYNTTVSSNNDEFLISLTNNGTDWAKTQEISNTTTAITGGGKQGVIPIYIQYQTNTELSHDGTITVDDHIGHTTEIAVSGVTQGLITTTLHYIGTSSMMVDTGNVSSKQMFEVRDANNQVLGSANITLATSDGNIISLVDANTIKPVCGGTATITASYAGDETTYKPATPLGQSITIDRLADEVSFTSGKSSVLIGDVYDANWATCLSGSTITYSSSDPSKVKIENGQIKAIAKGEVTLTATSKGDCVYYGTSATMTVTVKDENDPCGTLLLDKTSTFKLGSTSGTVDYTISDGEMDRLTFKIWNYQGASNVSVGVRLQDIDGTTIKTFTYTQDSIPHDEPSSPNKTIDLKPYPNTKKLHWYGSQTFNIKVSENKVYLQSYLNVGSKSITMSTVKGCEQATGQVEISYSDIHRIQFSQTDTNFRYEVWKNNVILPDGFDNDCGDHGTYLVKFYYTPKTKGDYSNDVTFSSGSFSQTVHISGTATAPDREIVWDLPSINSIYATQSVDLNAYAKTSCQDQHAGTVYYTASPAAAVDIVENHITFKASGIVTITAHTNSSEDYLDAPTVDKSWNVEVVPSMIVKLPTITSDIIYLDTKKAVEYEDDWVVVDSINGDTIEGGIKYIAPSEFAQAGPTNLTFNFYPDDIYSYKSLEFKVPVIVQKGMPTVTWATANNPTYNSNLVLGDVVLNGGSAVYRTIPTPGTFTWENPGQALQAGDNQTFNVIFTPNDTDNLKCDTSTISLNVLTATPAVVWGEEARVYPLGDDIDNKFEVKDAVTGVLIAGATTTMAINYEQTIATIINEGQTIHPITKNEMVVITASYESNNTNYVSHSDTVQLTFRAPDYYIFTGTGDWTEVERWNTYPPEKSETETPLTSNNILVKGKLTISSGEKEMLSLAIGADTASITINSTAGMTVGEGGATGLTADNFRIKSDTLHQAFFRMDPDATTPMPYATVEYATKATLDHGANKDAAWQYIGLPINGCEFTVDYITWLYKWTNPDGWFNLKNDSQPVALTPWTGYTITQYGQPTYEWKGQLLNDSHTFTLYPGGKVQGDNIIGNSYMSPIDVTKFTKEDFSKDELYGTFYIFNSGSWNQWQTRTKGGTEVRGNVPGTFSAIPILSSKDLDSDYDQTLIAPMQGIYVVVMNNKNASLTFNYEKHVWAAEASGKSGMNDPLHAPVRKFDNLDMDVLQSRVRLEVYAPESGSDHIYLLQRPEFTMGYDNGYDAPKLFSNGLVNLYTMEDDGEMTVSARNNIDSSYIGIRAGESSQYQLTVSSVIGDSLYLLDLTNNVSIPLFNGQTYNFNMTPNTKNDYRFMVYKRVQKDQPFTPTGYDDAAANAYIWVDGNNLHIENATAKSLVGLYASDGKLLWNETINRSATISIAQLPVGMYLVYVDNKPFKFVKKGS